MKWDAEKYDSVKAPQVDAGRELIAMAGVRENDSVLDIGCGTGKLTVELARLAAKRIVVGIDPSEEMLQKARKIPAQNMSLARMCAEEMDFSERFDLAFSNSAMHWVKDQEQAIRLTYKALKKDGRIAFQLPAHDFCVEFFDSIEYAISSLGYERFYSGWKSPWYFPTVEEYRNMLARSGFEKVRVFNKEYNLSFTGIAEVVDWWTSAGLRPYLAALPEPGQEHFKSAFGEGFEKKRTGNGIEFKFRRLFAFAEKED